MRRLAAFLLIVFTTWLVRSLPGEAASPRSTALALGFALIAAALAGDLIERVRLPRLTGYLAFGLVCGPYLANIIDRQMARELQVMNGLAVALIAFVAGLETNVARLRARLVPIVKMSAATLFVMNAALFAILYVAWPWLPIAPEASPVLRAPMAAILTLLVVSFSPTVTIAVITDSRARGPLTELVIALVVIADLALILFFTLGMQMVRTASGAETTEQVGLAVRLLWEIPGSFAFGAMVGALFAFYLRAVGREITLVTLGLCVVLSQGGRALHFDPLLSALAAGLVLENVATSRGEALKEAVERGALPVLVIFFASAGASLQLDVLASVGLLALGLAALRLGLIRAGMWSGLRWARDPSPVAPLAWMGLVSQAGVSLGLASLVAREFPDWGTRVQAVIVALTALHVLVGPIAFRAALARAGETGRS